METIKKLWQKQIFKFLLVGGLNTLFGYSLFAVLIYTGLHYTVAVFIGTIIGVLFNFKTTGKLVFRSYDNTLIWKFFGVYGIIYLLNIIGLYLLEKISIDIYVAGALLIIPMALVSFVLNKRFVFKG
ncbi:MAG: GtrA family protein [Pseudomonadota bacterium]